MNDQPKDHPADIKKNLSNPGAKLSGALARSPRGTEAYVRTADSVCSPLRSTRAGDLFGREKQAIAAGDSAPLPQSGNTAKWTTSTSGPVPATSLSRRTSRRAARHSHRRTKSTMPLSAGLCDRGIPKHARFTWSGPSIRICHQLRRSARYRTAAKLLRRIEFHYTRNTEWLNMRDEIGRPAAPVPGALSSEQHTRHRGSLATRRNAVDVHRMDVYPRDADGSESPLCRN